MAKQDTEAPATTARPRGSLLTLDTVARLKRETVTIDGKAYGLRHQGEMSITQARQYEVFVAEFNPYMQALLENGRLSEDDEAEARALLLDVVPAILDAPVGVLNGLAAVQLMQIFTVFTNGLPGARPADHSATAASPSKTGAKSPRGLRASTGSRRRTGSKSAKATSSKR